jgi:hypothetical protein
MMSWMTSRIYFRRTTVSAVDVSNKQVRVEGRMRQVQFEEITYQGRIGDGAATELSIVMHAPSSWGAVPLVDLIKYAMLERPDLIEQARGELASSEQQEAESDRMQEELKRAFADLEVSYSKLQQLKGLETAGLGMEDGNRRIAIHSAKLHAVLTDLAGEDVVQVRLLVPTSTQLAAGDFRLESFKMWDDGELSEPYVYPVSSLAKGLQWALLTEMREAIQRAEEEFEATAPSVIG